MESEWIQLMKDAQVPQHLRPGLAAYLENHRRTGEFLRSVLENDLTQAIFRADDESLAGLLHLMRFLHNEAPIDSWGTPERVKAWLGKEIG